MTADAASVRRCVEEYLELMDGYLDGELAAEAFQQSYWPMRSRWLDSGVEPPYEERGSLDSDVDSLASDPNDVAWHEIDEATFRARIQEAASRLRSWLEASS